LHLVSPQPGDKLHSQLECAIADLPGARPVAVTISVRDAQQRDLSDGDLVRVFNSRGACLARAHLSAGIRDGVVALPTGAWHEPGPDGTDRQGNPNVLTRDQGTSRLGQGSSAHTALVEIVPVTADLER
jgi:biotin/methionine sulfoxide reductase